MAFKFPSGKPEPTEELRGGRCEVFSAGQGRPSCLQALGITLLYLVHIFWLWKKKAGGKGRYRDRRTSQGPRIVLSASERVVGSHSLAEGPRLVPESKSQRCFQGSNPRWEH